MTTLEFHIATLALIASMGLMAWLNWRFQANIDHKLKEWEKCINHRMDNHAEKLKVYTAESLSRFESEFKSACRPRKASQTRKAPSLLKIKKIR